MNLPTSSTDILGLLRRHFPMLADRNLQEEIVQVGQVMTFQAGEVIMEPGSYVRILPLLVEGSIKVSREDERGNELFLYYLTPGQTCSMSFTCCMMHKKSEIRTVAEEDSILIGIPIRYMDAWMSKYQSWKNFVMTTYDDRMMELVQTIDSIAFKRLDERLEEFLERKTEATGSSVLQVTHQDIAFDLNASREAISRLLKKMERDGQVRLGRNQVEWLG